MEDIIIFDELTTKYLRRKDLIHTFIFFMIMIIIEYFLYGGYKHLKSKENNKNLS